MSSSTLRLKDHFRPLRRGPGEVQFGVSASTGAFVMSGLSEPETELIHQLISPNPAERIRALALRAGVPPERWLHIVEQLTARGLLDQPAPRAGRRDATPHQWHTSLAPDMAAVAAAYDGGVDAFGVLAQRRKQHVVVSGRGPLPWAIGSSLRQSGIGTVDIGTAAHDLIEQQVRRQEEEGRPRTPPDFVVLVAHAALDVRFAEPWQRRRVPHLPVLVDGPRLIVGPVINAEAHEPCLRCLDLHRGDRDPAWPRLLAQLYPGDPHAEPEVSAESSLMAMAAGMTTMIVHSVLAGQVLPTRVAIEVALPFPHTILRQWERHPRCALHEDMAEPAPLRVVSDR